MKTQRMMMKTFLVALTTLASLASQASLSESLESLGSDKESLKRAERLETRSRVSIVQNRTVPRDWRVELGVNYGPVASGDSYLRTNTVGAQADLHINPHFSLGVRYAQAFNSLTPEGKRVFDVAQSEVRGGNIDRPFPEIDYPESSVMGVVNWYMMYGKINFFDVSVVQFDIYSLAGYGQVSLKSGPSDTWTAGGGIGFWLNQHLTSRFEIRYQNYSDRVRTGSRDLDLIMANFGIGVLL